MYAEEWMTVNTENDYRLTNIVRKENKLVRIKKEVLSLDGEKALDAILGSGEPATLVQSFADQDLHFLMHHIGFDDFIPVLSLASSEQWEYILDMEVWHNDRINLPQTTRLFDLLFQADNRRLLRWLVREKVEFFDYYLFKHLDVRVREHDEDPSDFMDGYITIDDIFYFCFPEIKDFPDATDQQEPESADEKAEEISQMHQMQQCAESLITNMLNLTADMDLSVFQALLLESTSVIPSEVEEEEFRLKNARLAEKGFLPFYEAIGIYQPAEIKDIRPRPGKFLKKSLYTSDLPLPPQYTASILPFETLFAKALSLIDDTDVLLNLQLEFASLVNTLISADRTKISHRDILEKVVKKACCYLSVGLECIHGQERVCAPENGSHVIRKFRLKDIFRVGSGAGIKLKTTAEQWRPTSFPVQKKLPLTFLGEEWLGLVGGLLLDQPLYFDNYASGVLYRNFASLGDIEETKQKLALIIEVDRLIRCLDPDIRGNSQMSLTCRVVLLTLWARERIGLKASVLEPVPREDFREFFKQIFTGQEKGRVDKGKREDFYMWLSENCDMGSSAALVYSFVKQLFNEIEDEFGRVALDDLDANIFSSHFLIKK